MTPATRTRAQALAGLLDAAPQGWALPRDAASVWAGFLAPFAAEWALIEAAQAAMAQEIDPRRAPNLLEDWERLLGPDPYGRDAASLGLTTAQRGQLAYSRLTATGDMTPADYIALAASMGIAVSVIEYWPGMAGVAQCGDQVAEDWWLESGAARCGDELGWQLIAYRWLIVLPRYLLGLPEAGTAACADPLGNAQPTPLPAVIDGEAPTHSIPVYAYTG